MTTLQPTTDGSRWLALVLCLVLSCALASSPAAGQVLTEVQLEPTLDDRIQGTWKSRGYGLVLHVDGADFKAFHQTKSACIEEEMAVEDIRGIASYADRQKDKLRISSQATGSTIYTFDKIATLPGDCTSSADPTYESTFLAFSEIMGEHYAFFDLYGVNWSERVAEGRSKLAGIQNDAAFFELLETSLRDLEDSHLGLMAEIAGEIENYSAGRSTLGITLDAAMAADGVTDRRKFQGKFLNRQLKDMKKKVLKKSFRVSDSEFILWGRHGNIGIISIRSMAGFSETGLLADELRIVNAEMNQALIDLGDTDGIIVDVVFNGGGMDEVSLAIAGHFATETTFAYSKESFTAGLPPQKISVAPSTGVIYSKPVTLLTSNFSVSAAEIFTMAMRALPQVRHVGEATSGALSDILPKVLPNGWRLGLSHEVYKDSDGILWEGKGIQPEEEFAIFKVETVQTDYTETLMRLAREMSP